MALLARRGGWPAHRWRGEHTKIMAAERFSAPTAREQIQ
jgi:hypothetical protein